MTIKKLYFIIAIVIVFIIFFKIGNKEEKVRREYSFMPLVQKELKKDSNKLTEIKIIPKFKSYSPTLKIGDSINDFFYVKNMGKIDFESAYIGEDCSCTNVYPEKIKIKPGDSIKISFKTTLKKMVSLDAIRIIAVIGNTKFGGKAFNY